MIRLIGDKMLGGTGLALVLVMAFTVVLALIGHKPWLSESPVCGITYAMSKDKEVAFDLRLVTRAFCPPRSGASGSW